MLKLSSLKVIIIIKYYILYTKWTTLRNPSHHVMDKVINFKGGKNHKKRSATNIIITANNMITI